MTLRRYAEGERIVACISGLSDTSLRRSKARYTLPATSSHLRVRNLSFVGARLTS